MTSADHAIVRQHTCEALRVIRKTEKVDEIVAALEHGETE